MDPEAGMPGGHGPEEVRSLLERTAGDRPGHVRPGGGRGSGASIFVQAADALAGVRRGDVRWPTRWRRPTRFSARRLTTAPTRDDRVPRPVSPTATAGDRAAPYPATLRELAEAGIRGGATYDGLIAMAARDAGATLASLDRRAARTYGRCGVEFELLE